MKKVFALFLSVSLSLCVFSGCQSPKPASAPVNSGSPVRLTVWYDNDDAIGSAIQTELRKLSPNIAVTVTKKNNMNDALKLVGSDASGAPDMFFFAHDKIGAFSEMEILSPITDFVSKDQLSALMPMTVNAATYKNEIYQLPLYFETEMFIYNKKLMKTPPKTTEELYEYMRQNTKNGHYGFVQQYTDGYNAASWINAYGGYILNKDAKPGINDKGTISAIGYFKKFAKLMPKDDSYNTITTLFCQGKADSIISGGWLIPAIQKANIDFGVAAMPTIDSIHKQITPYSGIQGISVLKVSETPEKKEAIKAVLAQLLKPEIGVSLAKITQNAPANTKAYDDKDISGNEAIMNMKEAASRLIPMPNSPEMDVMWGVTTDTLSAVIKKDGDAAAECEKGQKTALAKIAAMK